MDTRKIISKLKKNKEFLIIAIVGIIINFLCFFFGSIYAKADSVTSTDFPFFVVNHPELNFLIESDNYNSIINEFKTVYSLTDDDNFIIVPSDLHIYSAHGNHVLITGYIFKDVYFDDILDTNDYTSRQFSFRYGTNASYILDTNTGKCVSRYSTTPNVSWSSSGGGFSLFGTIDTTSMSGYTGKYITPRYPFYVNLPIYDAGGTTPASQNSLMIMSQSAPLGPGFIDVPPIDEILNNILSEYNGNNNSANAPSPTPPAYDSTLTVGENLQGWFEWLGDLIKFKFDNIGSQLAQYFNNLSNNIKDGLNKVIKSIHDGFQTMVDNLKSFFEPVLNDITKILGDIKDLLDSINDFLELFLHPFDSSKLQTQLNNSSFYTALNTTFTNVSSFASNMTQANEPNSYKLTMDFSNCYFNFGVCTIDFDILLPFRPLIRLFIGALLIYGLVVTVLTSLDGIIQGQKQDD